MNTYEKAVKLIGFNRLWMSVVLSAGLALGLMCPEAGAQGNTGRILGTVTDPSGGAVNGAGVSITDTQRGITRVLIADQAGEFAAPDLQPGIYQVRVVMAGFKAFNRENILLEVGKDVRVDAVLQPGDSTTQVTVTVEIPMSDTTSATLGGTLSNETINDLPLNGRNYENLLQLRPGVMIYPGGGSFAQSTNGSRPDDNSFMVDGLINDEPFSGMSVINGGTIAGDASTILPIDAIQEFNTEENPRAEYGWKPGAVVDVGLKSGTNSVHGTAYAFGRDGSWDARNYFNNSGPETPVALEQFGGTVGGPIKKDKLFYFVGYEGQRYMVGSTVQVSAPTTVPLPTPASGATCVALASGDCANSLPDACNDLAAQGTPLSPLSLSLAGLNANCQRVSATAGVFPVNNGTAIAGNPTAFFPNLLSNNKEDNGLVKADYHLNDRNAFNGMYFIGQVDGTWNDAPSQLLPAWESVLHTRAQVGSGSWIWTPNSRWVNELRAGYDRLYQPTLGADSNINPTTYGINTGVSNPLYFGFPRIRINGFSNFQLGAGLGRPRVQGPDSVFQVLDHLSYLHGKHAFKFGGEVLYNTFAGEAAQDTRGFIRFGSLEDFLSGAPNTGALLIGDPTRHVHNEGYAVFAQDDWRILPRVTINLGLRYELNTVLKESHNLFGNFDPNAGLVQVGQQIASPYNGDHNNFGPRAGLAWDVRGDGKTVMRAGASVIYEQLAYDVFLGALGMNNVPTGAQIVTAAGTQQGSGTIALADATFPGGALNWNGSAVGGASIFPSGTQVQCGDGLGANPGPCNTFAVNRNLRTPYVTTWTLGLQRSLTNNLSLEVAYVGNHGTKLVSVTDINQPTVGSGWTAAALAAPGGGPDPLAEQAGRPFNAKFPYLANINYLSNQDKSNYQGLQVAATQRVAHGLSFVAGYTYSHALDNASASEGAVLPLDSTRPGLGYASSDFDIRHRFTFSVTYAIPGSKMWGQLLEGWQVNSIVTLQTGQPWGTGDTADDFSGTGEVNNPNSSFERWDFFGNPGDFTSHRTPIPFFSGTSNPACAAKAQALDGGNPLTPFTSSLGLLGCYVQGNSMLLPPGLGTFGTMGRNIFRDGGFHNWDLSVSKNWKFKEVLTAEFRAEVFNILNHPEFANPYGGQNGYANNDPSTGFGFGCGCVTPDQAAANPVLGSGGNRAIQLGLKLIF